MAKKLTTSEIAKKNAAATKAAQNNAMAQNALAQSKATQSATTTQKASSTAANDAKVMADIAKAEENRKATEAKNATNMAAAAHTPTTTTGAGTANVNTASAGGSKGNTITTQDGQVLDGADSVYNLVKEYIDSIKEPVRKFDPNAAYDNWKVARDAAYKANIENAQKMYDSGIATQDKNYANAMEDINRQAEDSLRQAYISNMLNQRNLNSQLADAGISGGATETVMANLLNNYQNNRNGIYDTQSNNIRDLDIANNAARDELYRNLLTAIANEDNTYYKDLSDYGKDINNMLYNSDESDISRFWDRYKTDLGAISGAASTDASNDLAFENMINSNDQKELDRTHDLTMQNNSQNWQSYESAIKRDWDSQESEKERNFKKDLEQMGIDASMAELIYKTLNGKTSSSGGSSGGSGGSGGNASNETAEGVNSGYTYNPNSTPISNGYKPLNINGLRTEKDITNSAINGEYRTQADVKNALMNSKDRLNQTISEITGMYKNSGGDLNVINNYLTSKVQSGYISPELADTAVYYLFR